MPYRTKPIINRKRLESTPIFQNNCPKEVQSAEKNIKIIPLFKFLFFKNLTYFHFNISYSWFEFLLLIRYAFLTKLNIGASDKESE